MRSNRRSSKQTKLNRKRSISKKNKTRSRRIYFRNLKGGDNELLAYPIWKQSYEEWNSSDFHPVVDQDTYEMREFLNNNFPDYIKRYNASKRHEEESNQPQYKAPRILKLIEEYQRDLESPTGNKTRGIPLTGEPRARVLRHIRELQTEYDQLMKAIAASNPVASNPAAPNPVASNPVESKPALTKPMPRPTIPRPMSRPEVASNPVASDKRPNVSLVPISAAAQPVQVQERKRINSSPPA